MTPDPPPPTVLHATAVAVPSPAGGPARGALLLGASGAGKSQLALRLLGLGALLVADDRTCLRREGRWLVASAPPAIRGMIEARGLGILRAPTLGAARLALAVDLDRVEGRRLPPVRSWSALGITLPLHHAPETGCLPSAVMLYLVQGEIAQP